MRPNQRGKIFHLKLVGPKIKKNTYKNKIIIRRARFFHLRDLSKGIIIKTTSALTDPPSHQRNIGGICMIIDD